MWNLKKKDTNELVCKNRKRLTDIENKLMVTKGGSWGRDKLGIWDWQIYTAIYKIHKQGPWNSILVIFNIL